MAKKTYTITIKTHNMRGQLIDKTLNFAKGDVIGYAEVPAHFLGQVAFHVDDNNGIIYDCYAKIMGLVGGKLEVKNGIIENPNGDFFILDTEEKETEGKLVSQRFIVCKAINA